MREEERGRGRARGGRDRNVLYNIKIIIRKRLLYLNWIRIFQDEAGNSYLYILLRYARKENRSMRFQIKRKESAFISY